MTIGEIIEKHPKTVSVFIDYKLHCVGCPIAQGEILEEAVKAHGVDLEKFLQDLNRALTKTQPNK